MVFESTPIARRTRSKVQPVPQEAAKPSEVEQPATAPVTPDAIEPLMAPAATPEVRLGSGRVQAGRQLSTNARNWLELQQGAVPEAAASSF